MTTMHAVVRDAAAAAMPPAGARPPAKKARRADIAIGPADGAVSDEKMAADIRRNAADEIVVDSGRAAVSMTEHFAGVMRRNLLLDAAMKEVADGMAAEGAEPGPAVDGMLEANVSSFMRYLSDEAYGVHMRRIAKDTCTDGTWGGGRLGKDSFEAPGATPGSLIAQRVLADTDERSVGEQHAQMTNMWVASMEEAAVILEPLLMCEPVVRGADDYADKGDDVFFAPSLHNALCTLTNVLAGRATHIQSHARAANALGVAYIV